MTTFLATKPEIYGLAMRVAALLAEHMPATKSRVARRTAFTCPSGLFQTACLAGRLRTGRGKPDASARSSRRLSGRFRHPLSPGQPWKGGRNPAMTRRLLWALLLFGICAPARAHNPGMTSAMVIVEEHETLIELSVKGSDLAQAVGVDLLDPGGNVDPERLAGAAAAVRTHLVATAAIEAETAACPLEVVELAAVEDGNRTYVARVTPRPYGC